MVKGITIKNKLRLVFFWLIFFLPASPIFAQRIIDITYQQSGRAYVFSAYNHAYCHYTVEIWFTSLNNVKADQSLPYRAELKPGINKLFSLLPVDPNEPVKFNYSSSNYRGCMHVYPDSAFPYLLPVTPGKQVQVYELSNTDKTTNAGSGGNNWYVIRLKMNPGDTIYASRKGVVTEVMDGDSSNDKGLASAGHENYIEIVQSDCSFAHYGILRRNSALVRAGQQVKAGQPVGLVGGDRYGRGSDIRFSVYYNQEEDSGQPPENSLKTHMVYVPFQCWTKNNGKVKLKNGGIYSSEFPSVIVNREEKKSKKSKK